MLAAFLLSLSLSAAAQNKPYLPSSVPVNFRPDENEGRLLSVGLSRIVVVNEWRDNFFSPAGERVGDTKVTATGLSLGLIQARGARYSDEWDLLAGRLESAAVTRRFHSGVINKPVAVDLKGEGFDFGARYQGGWSLARSGGDGPVTADWTVGGSLHALLFSLRNTVKAESDDGLDANHYRETNHGLFLRPSVAFQPVFDFGRAASVVPYAGVSTLLIGGYTEYEDTVFRRGGVAGRLSDDQDGFASVRAAELMLGFDLAVRPWFLNGHRVMFGGALTKLLGGGDGDFSELHLAYSVPLGR